MEKIKRFLIKILNHDENDFQWKSYQSLADSFTVENEIRTIIVTRTSGETDDDELIYVNLFDTVGKTRLVLKFQFISLGHLNDILRLYNLV